MKYQNQNICIESIVFNQIQTMSQYFPLKSILNSGRRFSNLNGGTFWNLGTFLLSESLILLAAEDSHQCTFTYYLTVKATFFLLHTSLKRSLGSPFQEWSQDRISSWWITVSQKSRVTWGNAVLFIHCQELAVLLFVPATMLTRSWAEKPQEVRSHRTCWVGREPQGSRQGKGSAQAGRELSNQLLLNFKPTGDTTTLPAL